MNCDDRKKKKAESHSAVTYVVRREFVGEVGGNVVVGRIIRSHMVQERSRSIEAHYEETE